MIRFAIVGCGHIAKKHAEAIRNVAEAELIAVCDTVEERMQPYVEEYGVMAYSSLDALLRVADVDVVTICTPSGYHRDIAVQAAYAGKHVIVEKPIALTIEDADEIIEACEKNEVKLSVVHPNRFRPAVEELRKAVAAGRFGTLSHANATVRWNRNQEYYEQAPWRGTKALDGGVLMNQAIHNLDLLLWIMGDVAEVQAFTATRAHDIETDDVAVGVVRFQNGALGVIEATVNMYPKNLEETLSVFGTTGTVKLGGTTVSKIEHWNIAGMPEEEVEGLLQRVKGDPLGVPGHQRIIEDMVEAIRNNRSPVVTGRDGRNVLAFIQMLYQASEESEKYAVYSK